MSRTLKVDGGRRSDCSGRIAVFVATMLVSTMVLTACGPIAGAGAQPTEEKVLVIALDSDISAMDPAKTASLYGPASLVYETLITRDQNGDYADGLAEWWNLNRTDPEHPTFEIRLKEGVVFHDGLPFTTDAVKRVMEYYAQDDSWVQYEFWSIYGCMNKTGWPDAGIWCKDDHNMVLNLTWADVALQFNLSHLYSSMMSPDALDEDGLVLYGTPSGQVVGTGPFMLEEWVAGDHVTLVKNPDYDWGFSWYENKGPATIDRVIYRIIPDQATRLAAFEAGMVDVLQGLPPTAIDDFGAYPGTTLLTGPGQGVYHVVFNCQKDPWTNVSLRRAFGYSVDRSEILETVWRGVGQEGVNYLPPILPESTNVPSIFNYSFDLDTAVGLFAEAGYEDTDLDGWLEGSEGELSIELWTANSFEYVMMGEILESQFEAAGVHTNLTLYPEAQLIDLATNGEHDAILSNYAWPRAEILDWLLGTWAMGGSNIAWYADPVFDEYVSNGIFAETEQEYLENATAGHVRLLTQGPWAPVLYWDQIFALHDDITGWYVNPFGQEVVFDILDVDITATEPESPMLSITSPEDGAVLSEPTVIVTGTTDPDVTLVVNGLLVAVEESGAFELTVALVSGTNEILATAADDVGETSVSLNVTYVDPVLDLTEQIEQLEDEISQLQGDLEDAMDSLEDALDSLDDAQSQIDDAESTIDSLESRQTLLLAILAVAAVAVVAMGIVILRMRKAGAPPPR